MTKLRLLAIAALLSAHPAAAEAVMTCDELMGTASAQYRDALYQSDPLHQDGQGATAAIEGFRTTWAVIIERSSECEPCRAEPDSETEQRIRDIADVAEKAAKLAGRGHIGQSHLTLGQIRPMLAELRHARGSEDYADHLDAFDDKLSETADDDLDDDEISPEQFIQLCEQVGVLSYLGEKLEKRAPSRWAAEPEFLEALESLSGQVRGLKATILRGRQIPIRAALSDLRQSFDRFYQLYG